MTDNTKNSIRLNKYIADSGYCSRREADQLVDAGKVTIDEKLASIGQQVYPFSIVKVNGQIIKPVTNKIYILFNKPIGIICTNDLAVKDNIRSYINYPELIFPVGRLDRASTGIILLTNDGDIVNKILRAENNKEKEYIVTVDKDINEDFIKQMAQGVKIYNPVLHKEVITNACKVTQTSLRSFKIILQQGLNRQIRRMTKELGYNVKHLARIRIMHLKVGNLAVGTYRHLTPAELDKLFDLIQN